MDMNGCSESGNLNHSVINTASCYCGIPAVIATSKKPGSFGKKFLGCSLYWEAKHCNYFKWWCDEDEVDKKNFESEFDLEELERELKAIEEEYERFKRMWNPWGVYEPLLDPEEFAIVMRDIEDQEEAERTATFIEYDSEDEEKGYTASYEEDTDDEFW